MLSIQSEVPRSRPYRDQQSPVEELDDGHLDERSQVINQNQPAQPQLIEDNRSEVLSRHLQSSMDRPQDQGIMGVKSVYSNAQMAEVTKGCLKEDLAELKQSLLQNNFTAEMMAAGREQLEQ